MASKPRGRKALSQAARLDRLALVATKVGVNVQPGQELIIGASVESLPLVRLITKHAYEAGASLVTTFFNDPQMSLTRYRCAADGTLDTTSGWLFDGMAKALENGAARLSVVGDDPELLASVDPAKVARAGRARSRAFRPVIEHITDFRINWSICAYAGKAWSRKVFPDLSPREAQAALFDAIFKASRVDADDPIAAWQEHNANLLTRAHWLNQKSFATMHFRGPGTDLKVGLADNHAWCAAGAKARNGVFCNANVPTEEVFTTPHRLRVDGIVTSTKPLNYQGTVLDGIRVRFEGGKVVEASAAKGDAVLQKMIGTDEGARRLGEVALVPHSSPISASGILFYETLFDENAACHIAFGEAYTECFRNRESLKADDYAALGANVSNIHVDWMIGSGKVDVDGIHANGSVEAVMRKGEWAQPAR